MTMKKMLRALALLIGLCLILAPMALPAGTAVAAAPVYRALLIGNNEYLRSPLRGCINDAKAIRSALQLSTGATYSKITLATDLTANAILSQLDAVRGWGQTASDVTLIYYSGHGFSNASGVGVLGVDMYGVAFSAIEQRLARIPGTIAVMIDSCYSGALIGKSAGTADDFNDQIIAAFSPDIRAKALSGAKYHVITACSASELSFESGGYGYFTTGLAEAMGWNSLAAKRYTSLIGDANKDGILTIAEGFSHASRTVGTLRPSGDQNVKISPAGSQLALVARKAIDVPPVVLPEPTAPPAGGSVLPGIAGLPNLTTAVIAPGWGYQLSGEGVDWTGSNASIATITSGGLVTGIRAGKCTITGKRGAKTVKIKLEVAALGVVCQKVALNSANVSRTAGSGFTLRATVQPASAKSKAIRWHSTNKAVATVSASGAVRPLKPGTAKIYAIGTSGAWAACTLTVTARPVTRVQQKRATASVGVGKTLQLLARALPTTATKRALKWTSADERIAVIGADSGIIRGLKPGKVYVTAAATDGSGTSSRCLVTVK